MPKIVDHDARRRQITDAVCRIALRGGLGAATFRQVAAEAGVSVRLVQHYFGTKATLMDITLQHVGERSTARLMRWIEATDGSPRAVLEAFLKSFIPVDDESRIAALMYVSLYTESVVAQLEGSAVETDRVTETQMMVDTIRQQLEREPVGADTVIDVEAEAMMITALMPGLGQYVFNGTLTAEQGYDLIDYHLDRLWPGS